MKQYIEKDRILVEIEKKKIPFKKDIDDGVYPTYLCALMDFEDFINTLEAKDMDLESEITLWANAIPEIRLDDVERLATYFFELGIKTQKVE